MYISGMRSQPIEDMEFASKKFHNRVRAAPRLVGRSSAERNCKLQASASLFAELYSIGESDVSFCYKNGAAW
jgi:hypothetical protein